MFSSSLKFQEQMKNKNDERRWRLFHATDFQSFMYPCFTFCRILGVFPYKINASSFEISKPYYILSTVITCIVCSCALIIIYVLNNSTRIGIKHLCWTIELNTFYIFGSFIMVVTYVLGGQLMHLLQTILKISSGLSSKSYQKQSILIHAKDIVGFFFLLVQAAFSFYAFQYSILHKVFALYITLLVFQMDMLYMNCVCVLKTCFKRINGGVANLLVMNNKLHLFRWVYQRNPFLLMELKVLEKQHLMICNTVQTLNMIFSLQLLATIIITFARITFYLYFCLVLWQDIENLSNLDKRYIYIFFITSIVFYFIKITLVVWACETGKDQANEISITIHNVFNSISDEQIKNELQLFSLQILHTRQNIFSAKGLTIGAPLLATVMGSIITYVFILLQFLNIIKSCDK